MGHDLTARTITITGDGGDEIPAYLAQPSDADRRSGVVVIHHMPGWDRATKEMVRRFAEMGYDAICPNLHHRDAPGASPEDAAAASRAAGGVPDDRLVGDVAGAVAYLRALPSSDHEVAVIGHCSGGRQAVLAACRLDVDAAIDCYGAYVTGTPPDDWPVRITNLVDQLPQLNCPLLGIFGNDDKYPTKRQVNELEDILRDQGTEYEFHRYDDAGHAFMSVDRPLYRPEAAVDAWERIESFLARHL